MLYTWPIIFNPFNIIDFCFTPFHFCLDLKWLYIDFACYLVSSTPYLSCSFGCLPFSCV